MPRQDGNLPIGGHLFGYGSRFIPMKKRPALSIAAACIAAALCGCTMSAGPSGPVGLASKTVAFVAGQTGTLGGANGSGSGASFNYPTGMVVLGGNIYVADSGNSVIREVTPGGAVTVFAGQPGVSGWADGPALTTAVFDHPEGIATDGTSLYVADSGSNVIRVISGGAVSTLAGSPGALGSANGTGSAATFNNPLGITYVGGGSPALYVSDSGNCTIRKVTLTGVVTTYAGSAAAPGFADSLTGTSASFLYPYGITTAGGNLYVVDAGNHVVRGISLSAGAAVTTLAGQPDVKGNADGAGLSVAAFDWPEGITTDGTSLYVADTVNCTIRRVVIATGVVSTLAGQAGAPGSANGAGNVAMFNDPMGLAMSGPILYVADMYNSTIRQVQPVP
jgi:hypothetical protein